jgi:hypothetical protein
MTDAEGVVLALGARGEGREPAVLLDGMQTLAPPGQHLVRIRLVPHVPHQPVARRVVDIMERNGELDGA